MYARSVFAFSLLACVALGCSPLRDNDAVPRQLGEACAALEECAAGLVCAHDGSCQAVGDPGTAAREEACGADEDCRIEFVCGGAGLCARSRQGDVADVCSSDASCAPELRCAHSGRCARIGDPGTTGEGQECEATADCGLGLICGGDGNVCTPVPPWAGAACAPVGGPPRPLFEVPRGARQSDFFTLPFPNDVLRTGNRVNLRGYPGTNQFPQPGEAIGAVLAAQTLNADGFGLNPAVTFRFSRGVDFTSLVFGGDDKNFIFVDITPDSDRFDRLPRARFFATSNRGRYVCENWLGIRPAEGSPLEAGHTYAVLFLNGVLDTDGEPIVADPDFLAVTGNVRPQFPTLAAAWDRYRPLKAWLDFKGILPEELVGGTVFTTGDPRRFVAAMRPAVHATAAPSVEALNACGQGDSPCSAACSGADGVDEFTGEIRLSNFLTGAAPFKNTGGAVVFEDGVPRLQRREQVCVRLAVPQGERPAGGWPLAIFAHDAGDDARAGIERGLASQLADRGWATLTYDGVLQGARAGTTPPPTGADVRALLNAPTRPLVARDHALQATADLHGLVRLLPELRRTVGGVNLGFDRTRLIFIGHGLGGELGVPFAAYEPEIKAVILAGVGGSVMDQLQATREPANLNALYSVALAEPRLDGMHAGMHLYQAWLDTRDPMNYAPLLLAPPAGVPFKHVWSIYGTNDAITPGKTMGYLAYAGRFGRVGPELEELIALFPIDEGAGGANVRGPDNTRFTQVLKQYDGGDDGHAVLFESADVQADLADFLDALAEGEVPVLSD